MLSLLNGLVLISLLTFCAAQVQIGYLRCINSDTWGYTPGATNQERALVNNVVFPRAYSSPPEVFAAVALLDGYTDRNVRFQVRTRQVTQTGFKVFCVTWGNSRIYTMDVSWISILLPVPL